MASAASRGRGTGTTASGCQHMAPRADAAAATDATGSATAETAPDAEPARRATAGATAGCAWRADVSTLVASAAGTGGTRQASAAGVAHRAAALGLAGPLGVELADRWRDGDPSSPAARTLRALRTAARARVMEVTDTRRTCTALS
eukprot:454161-Pleurochrysis_carterae.AAC.1